MTTDTPAPVQVEQVDRDAALALRHVIAGQLRQAGVSITVQESADGSEEVQAFARHRLATRDLALPRGVQARFTIDVVLNETPPKFGAFDHFHTNTRTEAINSKASPADMLLAAVRALLAEFDKVGNCPAQSSKTGGIERWDDDPAGGSYQLGDRRRPR